MNVVLPDNAPTLTSPQKKSVAPEWIPVSTTQAVSQFCKALFDCKVIIFCFLELGSTDLTFRKCAASPKAGEATCAEVEQTVGTDVSKIYLLI